MIPFRCEAFIWIKLIIEFKSKILLKIRLGFSLFLEVKEYRLNKDVHLISMIYLRIFFYAILLPFFINIIEMKLSIYYTKV